jgi:two-component system, chemotaxis family, protein-glutamate methylesterase/glutaminase
VTAANTEDPDLIYRAMKVGALEVWPKPKGPGSPIYAQEIGRFLRALKALARVPVVRHSWTRMRLLSASPTSIAPAHAPPPSPRSETCAALLIGASTGGPPVIEAILEGLARPFSVPIVVVQHITPGFVKGFASWLAESTKHEVQVVEEARPLLPGVVYLAGDDRHTVLTSARALGVSLAEPRVFQRPSVDVLFESAAEHLGASCIAVLLTGMGADGAQGMLALKNAGAFTIVQAPATCVVEGMPSKAIGLHAAARVLSPEEIPQVVQQRMKTATPEDDG